VTVGQNGGFFEISVPTVLGGHYEIQGQNNLNDAWSSVQTFDGDGTVQVKKLPASPATQQFWRVKGS
jgi:hypothetical protein